MNSRYLIPVIVFFSCMLQVRAQGRLLNNGTLIIDTLSEVRVTGGIVLHQPVTGLGFLTATGTGLQPISGNRVELDRFRMQNSGNAVLNATATVHHTADFLGGKLFLRSFDLRVIDAEMTGGSPGSYAATDGSGQIRRKLNATPARIVTGTDMHYLPLLAAENGIADTFSFHMLGYLPANGLAGGAPLTTDVAAVSWIISDDLAGGNDLDLTVQWPDVANDPSFNQSYAVMIRHGAGGYTALSNCPVNVSTIDPNVLPATGITATGTFGAGDDFFLAALPLVAVMASDTVACAGEQVTLSVNAGSSYAWSNGDTMQTTFITAPGDYFATLTDGSGCAYNSDTITIAFLPLPAAPVISADGPTTFCEGDSVELTSSYTSGNSWNTTDTTAAIIADTSGIYMLIYTDMNGCVSSASEIVQVLANPAVPSISAAGTVLSSSPASSYQWLLDGNLIPGAVMQQHDVTVNGNYSVAVTGANGCTSVSPVYVFNTLSLDLPSGMQVVRGPNPCATTSWLQLEAVTGQVLACTIADASGKIISARSYPVNGTQQQVDLGFPSAGMYFVMIRIDGEVAGNFRWIATGYK